MDKLIQKVEDAESVAVDENGEPSGSRSRKIVEKSGKRCHLEDLSANGKRPTIPETVQRNGQKSLQQQAEEEVQSKIENRRRRPRSKTAFS